MHADLGASASHFAARALRARNPFSTVTCGAMPAHAPFDHPGEYRDFIVNIMPVVQIVGTAVRTDPGLQIQFIAVAGPPVFGFARAAHRRAYANRAGTRTARPLTCYQHANRLMACQR